MDRSGSFQFFVQYRPRTSSIVEYGTKLVNEVTMEVAGLLGPEHFGRRVVEL